MFCWSSDERRCFLSNIVCSSVKFTMTPLNSNLISSKEILQYKCHVCSYVTGETPYTAIFYSNYGHLPEYGGNLPSWQPNKYNIARKIPPNTFYDWSHLKWRNVCDGRYLIISLVSLFTNRALYFCRKTCDILSTNYN